jgi:hypothetical protein
VGEHPHDTDDDSLLREIERRRDNPEFAARVRRLMDDNQKVLDRLADGRFTEGTVDELFDDVDGQP